MSTVAVLPAKEGTATILTLEFGMSVHGLPFPETSVSQVEGRHQ